MKIVTVVGARPQFIKAAVVSHALEAASVTEVLVHTGQHYDPNMSDVFFEELGISQPQYNLEIGSGTHGAQTGKMLEAIERVLLQERPQWVLVYGDTNSTLAGALAAAKLHIPIAHVEAGLRSFNRRMPEEINRIVADHLCDICFVPTSVAADHLKNEGVVGDRVRVVGDVMFDVSLRYGLRAEEQSQILKTLQIEPKNYVLATVHRAENTDVMSRLMAIVEGLRAISEQIPVVLPLHPRTKNILSDKNVLDKFGKRIRVIDPVGYLDMIMLEKNSSLIATDSGGVQKEAFFYSVPCVTLRSETEWVETVTLGWNTVVDPISSGVVERAVLQSLGSRGTPANPYGDGRAAEKIVQTLLEARR